jgi:6-phosphogluconolactonase
MKQARTLSIKVYDNIEELSATVAQRIIQIAEQALIERGIFHLALAGGETPRRCYELLRDAPIDWKWVQVYFGDERCALSGDAQRNDTMAYATLLGHVGIPLANVHAIPTERGARIAALEYTALLEDVLPLDLVLLGMGEDGHTASLFPGNPATEQAEIAVPVFNAPRPPAERVSLGMSTLNSARNKLFLVAGAAKRAALDKIMQGESLPAARVVGAEWHIDRAASPR